MSRWRWIIAEPTRIVMAAFLLVLAASAGGVHLVFERDMQQALAKRQDAIELSKSQIEIKLRRIEDLVTLLRGHAEGFIRDRAAASVVRRDPRVPPWLSRHLFGIHSFDSFLLAERGPEMGNLMALTHDRARAAGFERGGDEDLADDADLALGLTRTMRAVHQLSGDNGSVYFASPRGLAYAYPWRRAADSGFDETFFLNDFYQQGVRGAHPRRAGFWTAAHQNLATQVSMVMHGAPVYDGDRLAGVVAIEVALSSLRAFLRSVEGDSELLLVDDRRRLLADSLPAGLSEMEALVTRLPESLHGPVIGSIALQRFGQIVQDGVVVTFRVLDIAPWTIIEVLPLSRIRHDLLALYAAPAAVYGAVLVSLFLLTYLVVGRTFRMVKRANAELEFARAKAEEATQAKSQFLAMMSHEIRTPMNGVMSMAEILDQTDLSADQRSMSQVIRSSAQALLAIINDILDFSKIEAGKLGIEAIEFSLLDVVEGAGELIAGRADEKGLALTIDLDPAIPDRLIGDPSRLRQVLLNLLGNAIKFTDAGDVTLAVGRAQPPSAAERLRFEVIDSGIGMTEEQQERLFHAFHQADTSTSRRYGGTGLGLSICRRLVEMMGGAIGVKSAPGQGSTFWIELPFQPLDPVPDSPDPEIADAGILALGFGDRQAEALGRMLAAAGITQIRFAAADRNGVALAVRSGTLPDLVIVAAGQGRDGALQIGQAIAASGGRVALAAPRALASTLQEADRTGLFVTLTLPLRRRRLWQVIAAALGRAEIDMRATGGDADDVGWAPPTIETARAAGVLILVAEDNATNRVVISRMLSQRGYAHELAGDGAEALAKFEAGSYGLLLTDFHMPEMDGFELTAAIRAREAAIGAPRLPIIALTADALAGTKQRCLDAGMDGYLAKPIDSRQLATTLAQWLPSAHELRLRASTVASRAKVPSVPEVDPQVLDMARVTETFGGFNESARDFLQDFAEEALRLADAVDAALASGRAADARDHAHSLKGSALSTGALRLGQLAADVQDRLDSGDLDTAKLFARGLAATAREFAHAVSSLLEPA